MGVFAVGQNPKDRRSVPRYQASVACTVLPSIDPEDTTGDQRRSAIIGYTQNLSLDAIALILPSSQTYGTDPSNLGTAAELVLALPVGYVELSGALVRFDKQHRQGADHQQE